MSLEEEQDAMNKTFPNLAQGHIQKFLQGFTVNDKTIQQQEDSTEDLPTEDLKSQKDFLKKTKSLCFRDDLPLYKIQSKVIFFLQKLAELQENGLPSRAERRMILNYQLTFSCADDSV